MKTLEHYLFLPLYEELYAMWRITNDDSIV